MNSNFDFYNNFYIFKDLDVQKDLIHIAPYPIFEDVSPDTLSNDRNYTTYTIRKQGKWADLLCAGWPGLYVVSERVRNVMNELTGVNFLPINILDNNLCDIDVNYYRPQITGKSGQLKKELSKEVLARRVANGPEFIKKLGLHFEPESWDGSDFFSPEATLNIFITSKAKDIVSKYNFTNIRMDSISDVEMF